MCYMDSHVRVVNARCIEERPTCHDRCLFMASVQMQAAARDLFAKCIQCKITDIVMMEPERIRIQGVEKFLVLHNREKEALRYWTVVAIR